VYSYLKKRSAGVTLTVVAAMGFAARAQQRPNPCDALTFNEQACQDAVQKRGYCWNGKWVSMTYHYPFPYYYDAYQEYLTQGGLATPAAVGGACRHGLFAGLHGVSRAGFGASGAGHSAGG